MFTGASSSPGWTILLAAALKLFGPEITYLPFVLNALFTCLLLILLSDTIRKWCPEAPDWFLLIALLVPTFLEPLPAILFGGMEHAAHIYLMLLLVLTACEQLGEASRSHPLMLAVLSMMATALRYESFFVITLIVLMLWYQRQRPLARLVLITSLIPAFVYGAYSINQGWSFLPNSVIAKSGEYAPIFTRTWFANRASHAIWNLVRMSPVLVVLPWYYRARTSKHSFWHRSQLLLMLAIGMTILHCLFAEVGQWLFRYEAYLWFISSSAMVLAIATDQYAIPQLRTDLRIGGRGKFLLAVAALVVCCISVGRIWGGLVKPYRAMHDRFLEHIQEARFLSQYYDHSTVVLNDIGAVSYYTHVDILDVAGLASREPLLCGRARGRFASSDLRRWAELRKARIAILKSEWAVIRPVIPSEWTLVDEWVLPQNVVFGDHRVAFYAIQPSEIGALRSSLKEFASQQKANILMPTAKVNPHRLIKRCTGF